jgi:signal transduction histidine kinase
MIRRVSLRTKVTVIAGLALTAAVVLGLVLVNMLRVQQANNTIGEELRLYAVQIAQSGQGGRWPDPLPSSPLDPCAYALVLQPNPVKVLAASQIPTGCLGDQIREYILDTTVSGRPVQIQTMTQISLVSQVNQMFARLLWFGAPGVLILTAGTIWLVMGRALRPVERIRRTVTEITAADLSQRVPESGTADEIGGLAHTMNDMLARLDNSASQQRRFVADASHELRSPLAAIRTTLEVGLAYPDQAPWPEIARRAVRQTTRLEELVGQLLLLAKGDDRRLAASREPTDLGALLREVVATTAADGIAVGVHGPVSVAVTGDSEHLFRLFRNIVDNAIRYATHRVTVTITSLPGMVRVEIGDDGPGIPVHERDRVFDRFVRLDASRVRSTGSAGLGLAIAREIATAHGGTITIAEALEGGAAVIVTLPRDSGTEPESGEQ